MKVVWMLIGVAVLGGCTSSSMPAPSDPCTAAQSGRTTDASVTNKPPPSTASTSVASN